MKLVRDRISDVPWDNDDNKKYLRPVTGLAEHLALLRDKCEEELHEVLDAESPEEALAEAGDLLQALLTYLVLIGASTPHEVADDLVNLANRKAMQRGGFENGTVYEPFPERQRKD